MELKAIHLAILHFLPLLKGKCVSLRADNLAALACVRRQGSLRSPKLWTLSKKILELCLVQGISLIPKHLRGVLNVLADKGSRSLPIETEWSLDRETFLWICKLVGFPLVDLFATCENSHCQTYVSPCPDQRAWKEDAFSFDWNEWVSIYAFPPLQILDQVILHLMSYTGEGFLIAPYWPSKIWFPLLSERCPRRFPLREEAFLTQETSQGTIVRQSSFDLTLFVWIL